MTDGSDYIPAGRGAPGRELRDLRIKKSERKKYGPLDLPFLFLTLIILSIGVLMVLSASYARAYVDDGNATYYFVRQMIFAVSGTVIMLFASVFPSSFYRRMALPLLAISTILLIAVPIIGVDDGTGTKRWLDLKVTTFQPSEITKLAIVLSFSSFICSFKNKMHTFQYGVLPFAVILVITVGLLIAEPHLSASVIILLVGAILMFVGGTKIWYFIAMGGLGIGAGALAISKMGYAAERISSWKDPFSDIQGNGWQVVQSLYAIGSGGLLGTGLGQSRQKFLYLPEEHNDFIFSVVCEELGFIGAAVILLLFALLILRGYWLALHARDRFGSLTITGITSLLAIQVFFNVAVVTNLVPCTGISLPFFSYGGTALWIQLLEMGIILAISREIPLKKEKDTELEEQTGEE